MSTAALSKRVERLEWRSLSPEEQAAFALDAYDKAFHNITDAPPILRGMVRIDSMISDGELKAIIEKAWKEFRK